MPTSLPFFPHPDPAIKVGCRVRAHFYSGAPTTRIWTVTSLSEIEEKGITYPIATMKFLRPWGDSIKLTAPTALLERISNTLGIP